jgi:hypothetical protein
MHRFATLAILAVCACTATPTSVPPPERPGPELAFEVESLTATRFQVPIRLGTGKNAVRYSDALVVRISVDQREYDGLPPDIEPFLYIADHQLHTFAIDRPAEAGRETGARRLTLTFHDREWQSLPEEAPMVLTIDHGAPIRNPERFRNAILFRKADVR